LHPAVRQKKSRASGGPRHLTKASDQGIFERSLAHRSASQDSTAHDMIIEFAPLVFFTAAVLAIFLFFSVPEH
jgi:hypothetical protein